LIYEMRTYQAMPGKIGAMVSRFKEHTDPLFAKHGFRVVGYWTEAIGDSTKLHDAAEMEQKWKAFGSDPDWVKARAESERDGVLTAKVENRIWRPTSFSALQ
jgi:hypothetical protein